MSARGVVYRWDTWSIVEGISERNLKIPHFVQTAFVLQASEHMSSPASE